MFGGSALNHTALLKRIKKSGGRTKMEEKIVSLLYAPEASLVTELLRVWAAFRLESPLPLCIFHPNLWINPNKDGERAKIDLAIANSSCVSIS
jgi:hypothetical protein